MGRPKGSKNKPRETPLARKPYESQIRRLKVRDGVYNPNPPPLDAVYALSQRESLLKAKRREIEALGSQVCWQVDLVDPKAMHTALWRYNDSIGHSFALRHHEKLIAWKYWFAECNLNRHQSGCPEAQLPLTKHYERNSFAPDGVCDARLQLYCFDDEPLDANGRAVIHVIPKGEHSHSAYHPFRRRSPENVTTRSSGPEDRLTRLLKLAQAYPTIPGLVSLAEEFQATARQESEFGSANGGTPTSEKINTSRQIISSGKHTAR